MSERETEFRKKVLQQAQGALALNIAYIGVVNNLFLTLNEVDAAPVSWLAKKTGLDADYIGRWIDAAYAFEYVEESTDLQNEFSLTPLGKMFLSESGSLLPMAIQSVLSAHMSDRAAELMHSGERPGEQVLAERANILPWFGKMLEYQFAPLLKNQILNQVEAFREANASKGLIVDLGCGNGWYLRTVAHYYSDIRGIGLDGFETNIEQAAQAAHHDGLSDRLDFAIGDIYKFHIEEPVKMITMNRALHHVWDQKEKVFAILKDHLQPNGTVVIWEPNWPKNRSDLRNPKRKGLAFQNLAEHIQGNHFLNADEITQAFEQVGMIPTVDYIADARDIVVTGRKPE